MGNESVPDQYATTTTGSCEGAAGYHVIDLYSVSRPVGATCSCGDLRVVTVVARGEVLTQIAVTVVP